MNASLHNLCITLLLASAALAAASPATAAVYEARSVLEAAREQNDASGGLEHLLGWLEGNSPLTATLESAGTFTLFAPSDDAFEALELLESCGAIDLNQNFMTTLLNYHIARGTQSATQGQAKGRLRTRLGAPITYSDLTVTDAAGEKAQITSTAIAAGNGTMHIIDRVLWPYPAPSCG
jgi:uncharacterized surface protein with fasciclin (FAS1) repeats